MSTVVITESADKIPIRPIQWIWPHWLPSGKLTILAGTPGAGKTTLALKVAATITAGDNFPDGTPCHADNVVIWSGEDTAEDVIAPRLVASGADLEKCHIIRATVLNGERLPFDPATDIPILDTVITRLGTASLLIVDPIVSAISSDMHKANEVRRGLQPLVDFAERHNCAILGITHYAKSSLGRSPQERIIGSQAFAAMARMTWGVAADEETDKRVLVRVKTNIAPLAGGYEYSLLQTHLSDGIETTRVEWGQPVDGMPCGILGAVEENPCENGAQKDAEQFLQNLLADGPLPFKQIEQDADAAGHAERTLKRAKTKLKIKSKKEGAIWFWHLP